MDDSFSDFFEDADCEEFDQEDADRSCDDRIYLSSSVPFSGGENDEVLVLATVLGTVVKISDCLRNQIISSPSIIITTALYVQS